MSRQVFAFDHDHGRPPRELAGLLGGKGANLAEMSAVLHLPVPPGFTITTEAGRRLREHGWSPALDDEIAAALADLEAATGRRLGDPRHPLLLSVRSGAPVSMPGMMDTVLDVGLDAATTAALAARHGDPGFAADCVARLRATYRAAVGGEPPADPHAQLRTAIAAVFRSWDSERARAYRATERIADDLGTAVVVQAMVFGNLGPDSATGVCFSRDPAAGADRLYGDVLFGAQGDDVVGGTHETEDLTALAARIPLAAQRLHGAAHLLERHFADLVDIEFTIERGTLWLLQVRVGKRSPLAAIRIAHSMIGDPEFPLSLADGIARVRDLLVDPPRVERSADLGDVLATGLGASPGLASGAIVTTAEQALDAGIDGRAVILVRPETSPADVAGMAEAVGLVTARGGLASHAAVVARGWGKPAVVGTPGLEVAADGIVLAGEHLPIGTIITVDGSSGTVHRGDVARSDEVVPEAVELLAWAADAGIAIDRAP